MHQSEISRNTFRGCSLQLFYSEIKTERRSTQQSISNNIYPSVSPMEISRNPSKYLPMMLLFIHRHYVLDYPIFYEQWAPSPQSVSAIYIKISICKSYLMTKGNQFLNRGISFSLCKPTRGNIYVRQPRSSLTLLSVKIIGCRSTHQLIVRFFSLNPGLSNR